MAVSFVRASRGPAVALPTTGGGRDAARPGAWALRLSRRSAELRTRMWRADTPMRTLAKRRDLRRDVKSAITERLR
jgi:hypothetical protein